MKTQSTINFVKELTLQALVNDGWDTYLDGGYIIASREGVDKDLLICTTARSLSKGNSVETTPVNCSFGKVNKMIQYLDTIENDCIPCIAFGIIKYTIDDFEISIIPVSAIEEFSKPGSVYSVASSKYYYNFAKIESGKLPPNAILRKQWNKI